MPDGIIPIQEGGGLIQEGADNIDIKIDGKDTFHSMARAVFQICHYSVEPTTNNTKIRRSQERSIQMTDEASSLTSCLPFVKPKTRETPRRHDKAYEKISECANKISNAPDLLWVLLRSLHRTEIEIPVNFTPDQPQRVPFWTGFKSCVSEYKSEFSVVSYAPIIESKPNDMATVYTTMKKCIDMTKAVGQKHSIQTFDQQLYAIAKQVQWSQPDVFRDHIIRLGGFHTLSCFIAAIGKL